MYDLPFNSAAKFAINPLKDRVDLSAMPARSLIPLMNHADKHKYSPEQSVIKFYLFNQAMHLFSTKWNELEKLPDDVAKVCDRYINQSAIVH